MRFAIFAFLFALLAACVMAVAPLKSVIISYPNETPQSIVDDAMAKIESAGGVITHKYNIIKGFACKASALSLEKVQALSDEFAAFIEEDGIVHTNTDDNE